jgi:hypothetical protein
LRWSPGPRIRRRVELTGGCSAAAAGTRAPASTWFGRNNNSVHRLYWRVEKGSEYTGGKGNKRTLELIDGTPMAAAVTRELAQGRSLRLL